MNLKSQIEIQGYGTSEGVQKEWDERGRAPTRKGKPVKIAKYSRAVVKLADHLNTTPLRAVKLYQHGIRQGWSLAKMRKEFSKTFKAQAAGGQTDTSSLIGRKYQVVDTKYGHVISEHDTPDEAEYAARARPYSKMVSYPRPENSQKLRDMARMRQVKTNPDIDSKGE